MASASSDISPYVKAFEAVRGRLPGDWTASLRAGAMERFASLGLPGRKAEEWRYTDLKPLRETAFAPAEEPAAIDPAALEGLLIDGLDGPVLVFVNGRFDGDLSKLSDLPEGVIVQSFAQAAARGDQALRQQLAGLSDTDSLAQLNTAMMRDGYVIEVNKAADVKTPIQIVNYATKAEGQAAFLRNLLLIGEGASARVVETFAGDGAAYWTSSVTQMTLETGAVLHYARRQREGAQAVHMAKAVATLKEAARLDVAALHTGARSGRFELRVAVAGPGAHVEFNGVQLADSGQSLDTLTFFDHAVGGSTSNQVYKGVLRHKATASFLGKVLVRRDAQKTDAQQQSDSLLLDRTAEANAKPELEIYADDVQCAHGSTVGELSADQLFYLTARGIAPDEARAVLIEAFVADVLGAIAEEPVRAAFTADARHWLADAAASGEVAA